MALSRDTEFAGAPKPEGKGSVPKITPSDDGIGDWSEDDIAYLLETGNTPDFDVIGESMAPVQENMAQLTAADRKAIAAYIKSLPPRPDAVPKSKQKDEDDEEGGAAKSGSDSDAKHPDVPQ